MPGFASRFAAKAVPPLRYASAALMAMAGGADATNLPHASNSVKQFVQERI
jgi:hypothetical protein